MKHSAIILFLSLLACAVNAQTTPEKALQILDEKYPQEKIHLLLNKEEFVAGETIWFKAYLFSGYVRSKISSTLYVDLYTGEGQLLERRTLPLINSTSIGASLVLPASLAEGAYQLHAYTKWMKNFDPALEYRHTVLVYNPSSQKRLTKSRVSWSAKLYPESGTLLAGVENKIAVRLHSDGSLPESWSGTVVNKNEPGKTLASFSSATPDVASFYFTPNAGNVYQVHIKDVLNNTAVIDVQPVDKGILLKAEHNGSEVYFDIIFKGLLPENYKILGHMQQQVVFNSVVRKNQEVIKASFPVNKIMEGILHLTVFSPGNKPVAERLVFIDHHSKPPVILQGASDHSGTSKWWLYVDSSEIYQFAVAVTDPSLVSQRKRNLYTDFWLSDLSEMPNDAWLYFTDDEKAASARDALLITERWSRFNWNEVLENKFPAISHQAENFLSFRGYVTSNQKPLRDETVNLMLRSVDSSVQFVQVITDAKGQFILEDAIFFDTLKVYYQPTRSKKQENNDIKIRFERLSGPPPAVFRSSPAGHDLTERRPGDTLSLSVQKMKERVELENAYAVKYEELQGVEVNAEKVSAKEKLNKELTSPLFQTQNEEVFDIQDEENGIQSYNNILDWLDGRVAGLNFRILNDGDPEILIDPSLINQRFPMMRDQAVSLFIDEIPADLSAVLSLPPSEIALVKVIKGYFLGANSGGAGGGAIAIYTKRSALPQQSKQPLPSSILTGYSLNKDFVPLSAAKIKRDILEWKEIFLSPDINFSRNPDGSGYVITVTGFTSNAVPVFYQSPVYYR